MFLIAKPHTHINKYFTNLSKVTKVTVSKDFLCYFTLFTNEKNNYDLSKTFRLKQKSQQKKRLHISPRNYKNRKYFILFEQLFLEATETG